MDLKFWMFIKRLQPGVLAKILGCCPRLLRRIIERQSRPRGDLAYRIEFISKGDVSVDELINPGKYRVEWEGDKTYGKRYKKPYNPVNIDLEIKMQLNQRMLKYNKKTKLGPGVQSQWLKEKIAGQQKDADI